MMLNVKLDISREAYAWAGVRRVPHPSFSEGWDSTAVSLLGFANFAPALLTDTDRA